MSGASSVCVGLDFRPRGLGWGVVRKTRRAGRSVSSLHGSEYSATTKVGMSGVMDGTQANSMSGASSVCVGLDFRSRGLGWGVVRKTRRAGRSVSSLHGSEYSATTQVCMSCLLEF